MKQFVLLATVAHARSQCDGFQNNDLMFCQGLTKHPEVTDSETCKSLCCDDPTCDTWQWCPASTLGCAGWSSSRCWTGTAASLSSCESKTHWIGETKLSPAPVPTPSPSPSPTRIRKRGIGGYNGKNFMCDDGKSLGLSDSWHYAWIANPTQWNACANQSVSAEFVPMVNGIGQAEKMLTDHYKKVWSQNNVRYLLGYNEPDFGNGHNHPHQCTPADAAKDWPGLQALARMFDPPLELIAPSVASGGESGSGDAWDDNGHSTWLDEFFGNCTDVVEDCDPSMIKFLGMHDYWGDVSKLERKLTGAVKHYGGRKVWLTEIAMTNWRDPPSRDVEDAYMRKLLPFLDSNDNVFRYAWFSTRNAPNNQNGGSNLLEPIGYPQLTSTGRIYAEMEDMLVI